LHIRASRSGGAAGASRRVAACGGLLARRVARLLAVADLLAALVILLAAAVPALAPTLPGLCAGTAEGEAENRDQQTSHRKFTNHSVFPS
jgi:hypothetical protein